jgi:hypothetical protein
MLDRAAAQALDDCAEGLPLGRERVDDPTYVFHRYVLQHLDPTGSRVDGYMRRRCSVGVRMLAVVRKGALGLQSELPQLDGRNRSAAIRSTEPGFDNHFALSTRQQRRSSRESIYLTRVCYDERPP